MMEDKYRQNMNHRAKMNLERQMVLIKHANIHIKGTLY